MRRAPKGISSVFAGSASVPVNAAYYLLFGKGAASWERRRLAGPAKNRNAIVIIYIELLSPNAVLPKLLPARRWRSQDPLQQKAGGINRPGSQALPKPHAVYSHRILSSDEVFHAHSCQRGGDAPAKKRKDAKTQNFKEFLRQPNPHGICLEWQVRIVI